MMPSSVLSADIGSCTKRESLIQNNPSSTKPSEELFQAKAISDIHTIYFLFLFNNKTKHNIKCLIFYLALIIDFIQFIYENSNK